MATHHWKIISGHGTKSSILYLHSLGVRPIMIVRLSGHTLVWNSLNHSWMFLQSFYSNFISFFGTNLLTQCPMLVEVFCLFLDFQKISNKQSPNTKKLFEIFSGPRETLGKSTKNNSSRCKFQKHEIQSRHHHRGVHHPHWCLSDDAWVVHHRPKGP